MAKVEGKVALISGAAQGLGAAFARRLADEGAKVAIGDVLHDEGAALAAELGDAAIYVPLDVSDYTQWTAAVKATTDRFGRLDVLVNNAGIVNVGPFDHYTIEDWERIIAINLTGVFYGMKAAIEPLKASGKGSIINISSAAGMMGYQAICGYTAAKFGVRGLTKSAALDLGPYNVRVNSVHPGMIRTPMTMGSGSPVVEERGHIAMNRLGEPEEVANLVLYLASDESSFSTGSEFICDGGELAGLAQR